MFETERKEPEKGVSRRQLLGRMATAGAAMAAASFLPKVDLGLRSLVADSPPTAAGLEGEGFALMADATNLGKLIRWDSSGVTEMAEAGAGRLPPDSNNRTRYPFSVPSTHQWAMVIDLEKCDGCNQCQVGCDKYHHVPPQQEWIKVYQLQDTESGTPYWFPRVCNQCDNPPCVKVCPVGATFKREDGIVLIDQDRCIGCRFCLAACPYSARYFNWTEPPQTPQEKAQPYDPQMNTPHRKGVAEKCLFCPELLEQGKLPSCATSCMMGAIYFGDRNEDAVTNQTGETLKLSDLVEQGAYRPLEELGTHPRVYYLPPRHRKYPAPAAPKAAVSAAKEG